MSTCERLSSPLSVFPLECVRRLCKAPLCCQIVPLTDRNRREGHLLGVRGYPKGTLQEAGDQEWEEQGDGKAFCCLVLFLRQGLR